MPSMCCPSRCQRIPVAAVRHHPGAPLAKLRSPKAIHKRCKKIFMAKGSMANDRTKICKSDMDCGGSAGSDCCRSANGIPCSTYRKRRSKEPRAVHFHST